MYYLTFLSMCYPVKFFLNKRLWRPLFETAAARDTVNNCLFMTPSILWVLRVRNRCNIIKLTFPFIGRLKFEFTYSYFLICLGVMHDLNFLFLLHILNLIHLFLSRKICFCSGVKLISHLLDDISVLDDEDTSASILCGLALSCFSVVFAVLLYVCSYLNDAILASFPATEIGNNQWAIITFPGGMKRPIISDATAICSLAMHVAAISFDSIGHLDSKTEFMIFSKKGFMVYSVCLAAANFLAPIVSVILTKAGGNNNDINEELSIKNGRFSILMQFGLKYSALMFIDKPMSIIDSILLYQGLQGTKMLPPTIMHVDSDSFLSEVKGQILVILAIARISMIAVTIITMTSESDFNDYVVETFLSLSIILVCNCFYNTMHKLNMMIGTILWNNVVTASRRPSELTPEGKKCHGMVCFCAWIGLIGIIIMA